MVLDERYDGFIADFQIRFACGRWLNENQIPDDSGSYGTFDVVRDEVTKELRGEFPILISPHCKSSYGHLQSCWKPTFVYHLTLLPSICLEEYIRSAWIQVSSNESSAISTAIDSNS